MASELRRWEVLLPKRRLHEREGKGMSEINHAEIAERLENLAKIWCPVDDVAALRSAAADERMIASGELRPVVHGEWIKKYDSGSQNYNFDENWYYVCSKCGGWDKRQTKICHDCGALMDEKDGAK